MGRFLFALVWLLLVFSTSIAQQYNFKRFSFEEGLPRSGVYCLLEDSRGFLWIGTEGGGLARFDGNDFVTYTTSDGLSDNTVRCLFEDIDGNIWIGTNGSGLDLFNGHEFKNYSTEDGLSSNYVRSILQDSLGNIWIGTFGGGINRLSFGDSLLNVKVFDSNSGLPSDKVRAAYATADGKLWFGTDKGLCTPLDSAEWKIYTEADGLSNSKVLVLYEDALQNLWIGTESGLNVREGATFYSYTTKDGLIHDRVRGITQDHLGNMWFGTQEGVTRFDGLNFKSFSEQNGLSDDRVRYILTDRTGNIWFGTFFGGICRFSGNEFIHFTEKDGISSNQVLSVFNNYDGDIWLGTLEGITELIPNVDGSWTVKPNPLEIDFSGRQVNCVVGSKDSTIWIGTDKGVFLKKGDRVKQLETYGSLFTENTKAIFLESDSAIWVGSTNGVTRFIWSDDGYVFDQYHSMPSANESEVSCITGSEDGAVWIGYLNSSAVVFRKGEFTELSAPETLTNISTIITGSDNSLWFGTGGNGVFHLKNTHAELSSAAFRQISVADGLSSSDVHQLVFDGQGRLWVGTATGVDRLLLEQEDRIKEVVHFGAVDGFTGTETNEGATCLDYSGSLWFGTIRGATRYDPMAEPMTALEPKLHITEVSMEFNEVDLNSSELSDTVAGFFGLPLGLTLPYHLNGLRLSYNAIDLRAPHRVRYQWKLEGYHNDEWSLVDDQNSVVFTNLSPKTYTFHVRALGSAGVWNAESATYRFTVLAPFWMKWWFIALCAILFVLIIYGIIKQRERIYIKREEQLQRKVDERTFQLRQEKERSDELLLNILPYETAEELKEKGYASVQQYDKVSVLFTDFVGFTNITEGISHEELVRSLDEHFRMFDEVMDKYGIEKIKTIGDAYMAAGGIPTRTITNPLSVVAAGLEMIHQLTELNRQKELKGEKAWQLRLGIHTGSVISGVVGKNKFAFDIWGDAVNTAARMESSGEVMKVNISGSTYELVKNHFDCTPRGKVEAKNKGQIEMYFVDRLKPQFSEDESGLLANATFMAIVGKDAVKVSLSN